MGPAANCFLQPAFPPNIPNLFPARNREALRNPRRNRRARVIRTSKQTCYRVLPYQVLDNVDQQISGGGVMSSGANQR